MNKIFESLLNWANCSTRFALTFYFVWGISKGSRARCIFYLKNIKFLFVLSTSRNKNTIVASANRSNQHESYIFKLNLQ